MDGERRTDVSLRVKSARIERDEAPSAPKSYEPTRPCNELLHDPQSFDGKELGEWFERLFFRDEYTRRVVHVRRVVDRCDDDGVDVELKEEGGRGWGRLAGLFSSLKVVAEPQNWQVKKHHATAAI